MTPEQQLLAIIVEDAIPKIQAIFTIKQQFNHIIEMGERFLNNNPNNKNKPNSDVNNESTIENVDDVNVKEENNDINESTSDPEPKPTKKPPGRPKKKKTNGLFSEINLEEKGVQEPEEMGK